jgi:hypothetical protein
VRTYIVHRRIEIDYRYFVLFSENGKYGHLNRNALMYARAIAFWSVRFFTPCLFYHRLVKKKKKKKKKKEKEENSKSHAVAQERVTLFLSRALRSTETDEHVRRTARVKRCTGRANVLDPVETKIIKA